MKFVIKGRLPSLNEYIKECRGNKYSANLMKKRVEKAIIFAIREANLQKVINNHPIRLSVVWYEENRKRDIDNICFAVKFIQDALVSAGILENDNQKWIVGLSHEVFIDKDNPRIEVELIERV